MTPEVPWVAVLGASSGYGAATARAFAREGHPVLGLHLDPRSGQDKVDAVRADLEAAGVPHLLVNGNAARERHREHALDTWRARAGDGARMGVLVHSLAFGSLGPTVGPSGVRLSPAQRRMTLDVMAHSLVDWVNALRDREALAADARVFALTSIGGRRALPGYGAVGAAKAALEAHVRQLALELAPEGVRVNAVLAGLADTPALRAIPGHEALRDRAEAHHPSGRLTRPDDVASALVALTRPGLHWMTGAVVPVDGGESLLA